MLRSTTPSYLASVAVALLIAVLLVPVQAHAEYLKAGSVVQMDTTEAMPEPPSVPSTISIRSQEELARGIDLDTVSTQPFDTGRLWSLDELPADYLAQRYGIEADERWTSTARGASVRLNDCTGNFVSSSGLLLTSYDCVSSYLQDAGETRAFYARNLSSEQQIDGMYVEYLIESVDVTSEVQSALAVEDSPVDQKEAYARVKLQIGDRLIEEHATAEGDVRARVYANVRGDGHVAHVYHRYDDIRLVWAPERGVGLYGGIADTHSYPRFTPSLAVLRVFQGDEPANPPSHYLVNPEGTQINESVVAIGHPKQTMRRLSVSQMEFARDVTAPSLQQLLARQGTALADAGLDEEARKAMLAEERNDGLLRALNDPYIHARKADAEEDLANNIPEASNQLSQLGEIQQEKRAAQEAYAALAISEDQRVGSATFRRLIHLIRYAAMDGSHVDSEVLSRKVSMINDQPAELDEVLLTSRLEHIRTIVGDAHDAPLSDLLINQPLDDVAEQLITHSALASRDATVEILAAGRFPDDDPAAAMYRAIQEQFPEYAFSARDWHAQEYLLLADLRQHRYAHHPFGALLSAEADGSLRMADGRVQRYPYNGTIAPAFTSFSGLFNQHYSFGEGDWTLPDHWLDVVNDLRRHIPLNMVSSTDVGAGMGGAALLNADQELVGIVFDVNVEALASPIIFDPERMRTVSLDIRGIFEMLHGVYGADRIVSELLDGVLIELHEDAHIPSPTQ